SLPGRVIQVAIDGGDDPFEGTSLAQMAHQGAGVDLVHADDAGFLEPVGETHGGPPVGRPGDVFAHDEGGGRDAARLRVLRIHADAADERICKHHRLPGVGRVGEDFLVPGVGSVKDDLTAHLALPYKRLTHQVKAVFQYHMCPHSIPPHG